LLAAWNIFPNIIEEYQKTRVAFRCRGLHPTPFSPDLLKPMLVKAVLWSEALSVAMESKGFNGSFIRTEYYKLRITKKDILFPIATTGGLLLIVFLLNL
ncbi:MAG: energy-coupling factor transporter transmembrane protein EcfT, partial [Erysipelotrichia bacterium]|nr:energy-coupling factor transporter transmembrane protein EcfT [Erysipelotrichia bacterium]